MSLLSNLSPSFFQFVSLFFFLFCQRDEGSHTERSMKEVICVRRLAVDKLQTPITLAGNPYTQHQNLTISYLFHGLANIRMMRIEEFE